MTMVADPYTLVIYGDEQAEGSMWSRESWNHVESHCNDSLVIWHEFGMIWYGIAECCHTTDVFGESLFVPMCHIQPLIIADL